MRRRNYLQKKKYNLSNLSMIYVQRLEENIQKIFDPLFTTGEKGIGLGLAIAKEIIDEHKGSISVESEIEKGTISKIKLPIT